MASIALASYTVRVRERRGDPLLLGHLPYARTLLEEFRVFASEMMNKRSRDDLSQSVLYVTELHEEPDTVWGLVHAGGYGSKRNVVNSETFGDAYLVKRNEAVTHPFYFMLYSPPDANRALLILQRHGHAGVLTAFTSAWRTFFTDRNDLILEVSAHVPQRVLDSMAEGELRRVEYRSYEVPAEVEDTVKWGGNVEGKVVVKTTITAKRGESLPMTDKLKDLILGADRGRRRLLERLGEAVEPEEMSLTFNYGRSSRTLNLTRPDSLFPYVDITDDVEISEEEGHPIPTSTHAAATNLRQEIWNEMKPPRDDAAPN